MADGCLFCGEPALFLCDAPLGFPLAAETRDKQGRRHRVTDMAAMLSGPYTCDASCCEHHVRHIGRICAGGEADSIDRCVKCAERQGRVPVLPLAEITTLRSTLHAEWRRERIRLVIA